MGFLDNMRLQNAYRVAASFDYNRDGNIKTNSWFGSKELEFDRDAKKRTDFNKDGKISIDELAQSLAKGDVFIGYDREVHSNNPFGGGNGGINQGYPYPGGGSPYYPGAGSVATYSGSIGYGYGGGVVGLGNAVGGVIGAIGSIFR